MLYFGQVSGSFHVILIIALLPSLALGIKCDCTLCRPRTYCEVDDGICMVTVRRNVSGDASTDSLEETVSCVPSRLLFPPNTTPFICRTSKLQLHEVNRECCGEGDYCNKYLNISRIFHDPFKTTAEKQKLLFTTPANATGSGVVNNGSSPDEKNIEQTDGFFADFLAKGRNLVLAAALLVCLLALLVFLCLILFTLRQLRKRESHLSHGHIATNLGNSNNNRHQLSLSDTCSIHKIDESTHSSSSVSRPRKVSATAPYDDDELHGTNATGSRSGSSNNTDETNSLLNLDATSGSGSGLPILLQRTIARQIKINKSLGKGRFGEVFLGLWNGEQVAVKVFCSRDVANWMCETEIFQRFFLRHENVVSFIASDTKDNGRDLQHWLIMEYYPFCLYDFLAKACVDIDRCLRLCASIIKGLAFLHTPICNSQRGKPAIAHLDVKTKNILIKSNGDCVIADLGLAVVYQPPEQQESVAGKNMLYYNNNAAAPCSAANLLTMQKLNSFIYMMNSPTSSNSGSGNSSTGNYHAGSSGSGSSGYCSAPFFVVGSGSGSGRSNMAATNMPSNICAENSENNNSIFDRKKKKMNNLSAAQQQQFNNCSDPTIVPLLEKNNNNLPIDSAILDNNAAMYKRFLSAAKARWSTAPSQQQPELTNSYQLNVPTIVANPLIVANATTFKLNRLNTTRGSLISSKTCLSVLPPAAHLPSQLPKVVNTNLDENSASTATVSPLPPINDDVAALHNSSAATSNAPSFVPSSNLSATTGVDMNCSGASGGTHYRMGTSRYAAPEVLAGTLNTDQFESFAAADMYSFALVVWEIATRTYCPCADVDDFELPYQEFLGGNKCNPSADEMRSIVFERNLRPTVRTRWLQSGNARMTKLVKLMVECWNGNPHARMPALLARKTLALLVSDSGTSRFFEKMTPLDLMAAGLDSGGEPLHISLAGTSSGVEDAAMQSQSDLDSKPNSVRPIVCVPVDQHAEPAATAMKPADAVAAALARLRQGCASDIDAAASAAELSAVKLMLKQIMLTQQQQQLSEKLNSSSLMSTTSQPKVDSIDETNAIAATLTNDTVAAGAAEIEEGSATNGEYDLTSKSNLHSAGSSSLPVAVMPTAAAVGISENAAV